FADHNPELAQLVREGRGKFLSQFRSLATPEMQAVLHDPAARDTFEACKLDFGEREKNAPAYAMHRELLRIRQADGVFSQDKPAQLDGAILNEHAFLLRWLTSDGDDRLLLVN